MNSRAWNRHAMANRLQTLLLLTIMAGFLALLGWLLWGIHGIVITLIIGFMLMVLHPALNPRLIMRLYRAERLSLPLLPELDELLIELTRRSGLNSPPELYYIPSPMINSFAVGRADKAIIALTDGLLRALNLREVGGVLAHEISHIRSKDMSIMGLADLFSRLTSLLSLTGQMLLLLNLPLVIMGLVYINWLLILLLMLAPLVSTLAQLSLSRTREYEADLNAIRLTADPEGLASALLKIDRVQGSWLERLILPGKGIPEPSILRTHPPTEERVRRLLELHQDSVWHTPQSIPLAQTLSRNRLRRRPGWHITGLWH